MMIKDYVLRLKNLTIADSPEVGTKNAFLGEIFTHPTLHNIKVPDGFAITSTAFHRFIEYNKLDGVHEKLLASLDCDNLSSIEKAVLKNQLIEICDTDLRHKPGDLRHEI